MPPSSSSSLPAPTPTTPTPAPTPKSLRALHTSLLALRAALQEEHALLQRIWYKSRAQFRSAKWMAEVDGVRRGLGRVLGGADVSAQGRNGASKAKAKGRAKGKEKRNEPAGVLYDALSGTAALYASLFAPSPAPQSETESAPQLQPQRGSGSQKRKRPASPPRHPSAPSPSPSASAPPHLDPLSKLPKLRFPALPPSGPSPSPPDLDPRLAAHHLTHLLRLLFLLAALQLRARNAFRVLRAHLNTPPAPTFAPLVCVLVGSVARVERVVEGGLWGDESEGETAGQAGEGRGEGQGQKQDLGLVGAYEKHRSALTPDGRGDAARSPPGEAGSGTETTTRATPKTKATANDKAMAVPLALHLAPPGLQALLNGRDAETAAKARRLLPRRLRPHPALAVVVPAEAGKGNKAKTKTKTQRQPGARRSRGAAVPAGQLQSPRGKLDAATDADADLGEPVKSDLGVGFGAGAGPVGKSTGAGGGMGMGMDLDDDDLGEVV